MSAVRTPYPEAAKALLRETLFGAARDEIERRPWSQITMSDIAARAGVSRQTLYKEFGSRNEFGLAFVIHEGERFLDEVDVAVRERASEPRGAVAAAFGLFLRAAGEDALIRIMLSDDGTGGMLPFVTTRGMPVVQWATARLVVTIEQTWPRAAEAEVRQLAETLVRLAISHITVPDESAERAAATVTEVLGPFVDRVLDPDAS